MAGDASAPEATSSQPAKTAPPPTPTPRTTQSSQLSAIESGFSADNEAGSSVVACKKSRKPTSPVPGMSVTQARKAINQALKDLKKMLRRRIKELERWNKKDKARFKKWFGTTKPAARKKMKERMEKMLKLVDSMSMKNFKKTKPPDDNAFAYVHPNDKKHRVYLGKDFATAPATGPDSKAGTLGHELSHFDDIGGTEDHAYGRPDAKALAKSKPSDALENADNFEYYLEGGK